MKKALKMGEGMHRSVETVERSEQEINGNNKCYCIFIVNRRFDFFYMKDLHKGGLSLSSIVYGFIPSERNQLHWILRIAYSAYCCISIFLVK